MECNIDKHINVKFAFKHRNSENPVYSFGVLLFSLFEWHVFEKFISNFANMQCYILYYFNSTQLSLKSFFVKFFFSVAECLLFLFTLLLLLNFELKSLPLATIIAFILTVVKFLYVLRGIIFTLLILQHAWCIWNGLI